MALNPTFLRLFGVLKEKHMKYDSLICMAMIVSVFLLSCDKSVDDTSNVSSDCPEVTVALLEKDLPLIQDLWNDLFVDLFASDATIADPFGHEENFDKLILRMEEDCNQINVRLICYGCIETFPNTSELELIISGETSIDTVIMDVLTPGDDVLSISGLHD